MHARIKLEGDCQATSFAGLGLREVEHHLHTPYSFGCHKPQKAKTSAYAGHGTSPRDASAKRVNQHNENREKEADSLRHYQVWNEKNASDEGFFAAACFDDTSGLFELAEGFVIAALSLSES
jgi:hypothetical protein